MVSLALFKENHLCILTAQFDGGSHIVIFFLEGDGIGNNLLNIAAAKGFSQMLGTGACQGQTDTGIWKFILKKCQGILYTLGLGCVVAFIIR